MKKILMKWAAVLCCVMITSVFTSCLKSEEEMQNDLIGTWTESNNLFTDILKINADGSFSFKCHIAIYNGVQGYAQKQYLRLVSYTPGAQQQTASPSVYAALTTGSQGTEVSALQGALKELGFYTSSVDGQYGPGTRSAVLAFQKANGLAQTGIADSATQTLLYEGAPFDIKGKMMSVTQVSPISGAPIQMGSTGEAVRNLQLRLKELGYYLVTVDGVATEALQKAILAEADGATPEPTATPAPTQEAASGYQTLQYGMSGEAVKALQLNAPTHQLYSSLRAAVST